MSTFPKKQSLQKYQIILAFCLLTFLAREYCLSADPPSGAEATTALETTTESSAVQQGDTESSGEISDRNLFVIIQQGGLLLYPILFASFILFLFVFERLISLRRRRVIPRPFVRQFLHQLRERSIDQEEALAMCRKNGSPVAEVFAGAVQKWGRPAVEVEQAIIDSGERVTGGLRRYLRLINGIATVTPLLGLLGTVVGMIQAFNDIATADAMGKPELLAAGIGQALITTAGGLTVAIPALIAYMFFLSRVDRLVMDIDAVSQDVVAEISAEAGSRPKKTSRTKLRKAPPLFTRNKKNVGDFDGTQNAY